MTEITKIGDVDSIGNRKTFFIYLRIGRKHFFEPISKPRLKRLVREALKQKVQILCSTLSQEAAGAHNGPDGAIRVEFKDPTDW